MKLQVETYAPSLSCLISKLLKVPDTMVLENTEASPAPL